MKIYNLVLAYNILEFTKPDLGKGQNLHKH